MELVNLIGLLAGGLTTIAFLPQVIKTWQTKSTKDISMGMLLMFISGLFLWLVYGLYLGALPVIVANFATILLNLPILWCKLKYK